MQRRRASAAAAGGRCAGVDAAHAIAGCGRRGGCGGERHSRPACRIPQVARGAQRRAQRRRAASRLYRGAALPSPAREGQGRRRRRRWPTRWEEQDGAHDRRPRGAAAWAPTCLHLECAAHGAFRRHARGEESLRVARSGRRGRMAEQIGAAATHIAAGARTRAVRLWRARRGARKGGAPAEAEPEGSLCRGREPHHAGTATGGGDGLDDQSLRPQLGWGGHEAERGSGRGVWRAPRRQPSRAVWAVHDGARDVDADLDYDRAPPRAQPRSQGPPHPIRPAARRPSRRLLFSAAGALECRPERLHDGAVVRVEVWRRRQPGGWPGGWPGGRPGGWPGG